MFFLVLGILFLLLKSLAIGPVEAWSWTVVLAPFGLAVVWWWWADASGYTKRKVMEKEAGRKQARIDKSREVMGLKPRKPR